MKLDHQLFDIYIKVPKTKRNDSYSVKNDSYHYKKASNYKNSGDSVDSVNSSYASIQNYSVNKGGTSYAKNSNSVKSHYS